MGVRGDLLQIVKASKALNSKLFSLPRMLIMRSLADLPEGEVVPFRELKASLDLGDGVLFANLKVLKRMEYIEEQKVTVQGEEMHAYALTKSGREELERMRNWISRWVKKWNDK